MERVSIISGKLPVIIVAPHGYDRDDENTALIAEEIANKIDAYAVINRGWERDDKVDYLKDKADCNNVLHCNEDVVKEEFLDPIVRYKNKILQSSPNAFIYFIHGMGNRHRKIVGDDSLDMVLGFGAGSPNSFTCEMWHKDYIGYRLKDEGVNAFEGSKGGAMSGWTRNNMNQLFRKWQLDPRVNSMQIEIVHDLREDEDISLVTAACLATAIKGLCHRTDFNPPTPVRMKSY